MIKILIIILICVCSVYSQNIPCGNLTCSNNLSCVTTLNFSTCLDVCKCSRNEKLSWENMFGCNETLLKGDIRIEHLIIVIFGVWLPYVSLAASHGIWFGAAVSFYVILGILIVYAGICLSNSFLGLWVATLLITKLVAFFQVWLWEKPMLIAMSLVHNFFTMDDDLKRNKDEDVIIGKFFETTSLRGILAIYVPGLLFLIPIFAQLDQDSTIPWILITGGIMLFVSILFAFFLFDGVDMICAIIINTFGSLLVIGTGIGIAVDPEHLGFIVSYSITMGILFVIVLIGAWLMGDDGINIETVSEFRAFRRTRKTVRKVDTEKTELVKSSGDQAPISFLTIEGEDK